MLGDGRDKKAPDGAKDSFPGKMTPPNAPHSTNELLVNDATPSKKRKLQEEEPPQSTESKRTGHVMLTEIRRLKTERDSLFEKFKKFELKTLDEMAKIRDAWKEKLDTEKLKTAQLRKKLSEVSQQYNLDLDERNCVSLFKEKVDKLTSEVESLRKTNEALVQSEAALRDRLGQANCQLSAWHSSAVDFCDENDDIKRAVQRGDDGEGASCPDTQASAVPVMVEMQMRLFDLKSIKLRYVKERERLTAENRELRRKVREVTSELRTSDKDKRSIQQEMRKLETAVEKMKEREEKLCSQIQVLRRCIKVQTVSSLEGSSGESPCSEPVTFSHGLGPVPEWKGRAAEELDERREEVRVLKERLQEADRAAGERVKALEKAVAENKAKVDELENVKGSLLTQLQSVHVKFAATKTELAEIRTAPRLGGAVSGEATDRLIGERDRALKRCETLRIEAKSKKELLLLAIEKALGWRIVLAEGEEGRFLLYATAIFSPEEDPGSLKFCLSLPDLIPFVRSSEVRQFLETREAPPPLTNRDLGALPVRGESVAHESSTPIQFKATVKEPRLEMSFVGRYRDKWRKDLRWKQQLLARKPSATFAAFLLLDEHANRQKVRGWPQPAKDSPAAKLVNDAEEKKKIFSEQ